VPHGTGGSSRVGGSTSVDVQASGEVEFARLMMNKGTVASSNKGGNIFRPHQPIIIFRLRCEDGDRTRV
jgi:hypothetical protein